MGDVDGPDEATPRHRGWYSRGYLPHLDAADLIQHITFHLADSIPSGALERLQWELESMPEGERSSWRRRRLHALLDAGRGSCTLKVPQCAEIVEQSLLHGDGERYRLLCWVVMPNHVHVPIKTHSGWPLGRLVQSWKRHCARRIHTLFPDAPKPFWQRDYWDRFVRNDDHLEATRAYIEQNPVNAGLVDDAREWPWGSARFNTRNC